MIWVQFLTMFESICWSTLGCHSGSPVLNLCFCVVSEILFCNVRMEHSRRSDTTITHSRNSHYLSEVESSVLYSNFEVHCLALNSFFVFKNTLWSYHALSSVCTGLSVVVLSLGLCVQYCVQDNCIISTEMFLLLEMSSMSWSKHSFPVSCMTLVLFLMLP